MRAQDGQHRLTMHPGVAEIAGERLPGPGQIAGVDRLVEAQQRLEPARVLVRELRVRHDKNVDRVAGHEADQAIDHEGHDRQQQDGFEQPLSEKAGHGAARQASTLRVLGNWWPVGSTPFSQLGRM